MPQDSSSNRGVTKRRGKRGKRSKSIVNNVNFNNTNNNYNNPDPGVAQDTIDELRHQLATKDQTIAKLKEDLEQERALADHHVNRYNSLHKWVNTNGDASAKAIFDLEAARNKWKRLFLVAYRQILEYDLTPSTEFDELEARLRVLFKSKEAYSNAAIQEVGLIPRDDETIDDVRHIGANWTEHI